MEETLSSHARRRTKPATLKSTKHALSSAVGVCSLALYFLHLSGVTSGGRELDSLNAERGRLSTASGSLSTALVNADRVAGHMENCSLAGLSFSTDSRGRCGRYLFFLSPSHLSLIAARGGEMMWIDFEDVCLGPPEWDLATMMDEEAVAKYHDPDSEMLARCTELRTLQVALALIVFRDEFGDMKGWDEGIRSMLDMLTSAF